AQAKFVHTVAAGYVVGSVFVLAISAWYLLRDRNVELAKRSMAVAASFGLACSLSVVVLGDESGYTASTNQRMKIAAIEAEWKTETPPASFTLFGFPDVAARTTYAQVTVPWLLGLIATRSADRPVPGILDLVAQARQRIASGAEAYAALTDLRRNPADAAARASFTAHQADLGYGMLLLRYTPDPLRATPPQIDAAAWSTVPNVPVLFWCFRLMVGLGFFFIALFAAALYLSTRHRSEYHRGFLRVAFWSLPLPWIAAELGWVVAEYGRQPWAIDGVLPTFMGASPVPVADVIASLAGFILFYSALATVEVYLMRRMIRKGPDMLGYWPPPRLAQVLPAAAEPAALQSLSDRGD
ncbi:MAG TPA: cytochrome ubiquinol oxidase subunit I, partial [Steroidobacteraceae bacterium]|nr:cytochrome ubiquinol oxidase subunit I [Steroidobacteraceae bacterium]